MTKKLIVIITLAFSGGIAADRLFLSETIRTRNYSSAIAKPASDSDQIILTGAHPLLVSSDRRTNQTDEMRSTELKKVNTDLSLEAPAVFDPEDEAKLAEVIMSDIPAKTPPISEQVNEDHSIDQSWKSVDGREVRRHFNPQGELSWEQWEGPLGERVYRSFYQPIGIRWASWNRPNGASISLGFTQSGVYESRTDRLPNDLTIITDFDDLGRAKEVQRVKNGAVEKIWP